MDIGRATRSAALAAACLLAGCGPTPSELQLNAASQYCAAGYQQACYDLPAISAQAQLERGQQNTAAAVVGVVGAVALVGAAVAADGGGGGYRRGGYDRRYYRR